MSQLKTWTLFLLLSGLSACGRQVVEFKSDAAMGDGADGDTPDARASDASTSEAPTVIQTEPADAVTGVAVNVKITATFSEAMDPSTLTATTFILTSGARSISCAVTQLGTTATCAPVDELPANSEFTATITTAARSVSGHALAQDYEWTFTTGAAADVTAPMVTFTVPARADLGVSINRNITASFNEAMDAATITAANFTLKAFGNSAAISGKVTLDATSTTAIFNPDSSLQTNTSYVATLTVGVKDRAGNAIAADYNWSFTTSLTADNMAPRVIATSAYGGTGNTSGATGLPINRVSTATFSEPMAAATLISPAMNFTLKEFVSGNPVAGAVSYIGTTATFTPAANLLPNTEYVSTVTTAATDLADNPLAADYVWTWTTAATPDTAAPEVILTSPADLAMNVPVGATINATFSEAMKPTTIVAANVLLREKATLTAVQGLVAYDILQNIVTFSPNTDLLPGTDYVVTVTNGATDLAGNALVVPAMNGLPKPNPWEFRTAALVVPPPPLAINLGAAASFGIASRAGLTSTGVTVINGDVALYPLANCTDATGNAGASQTCLVKTYSTPNGMTVNGSIYWAGDPYDNGGTALSVTNALTVAWTEGRNKIDTRGAVLADQLGGKTLLPGVYHNAALALMAGGVAQLDAQNDANAIFVFKVDSSFVDSGTLLLKSRIDLINGAQARNVWFVTGLDIVIGSGTTWNGNILAGRTATILDGSNVTGRVLAGASGAGAMTLTGAASPSSTSISVPQ
ncbi:MAG: Ig-like domain-containing protein [Vicinamibacterales bacterium]